MKEQDKKPVRNRPSEEGKQNDPNIRDESAPQPGVQTMSSSKTDEANQELTRTAADHYRTEGSDSDKADPRFDEIENKTD